jgi:tetratricopeptide (TPR) repeat protein
MNARELWRERIRPVVGFPGLLLLAFLVERMLVAPRAAERTPESAVAYWQRQAERHPDFPLTQSRLGLEYSRVGDFAKARGAFERALASNPDAEQAAVGLNGALRAQGELPAAVAQMTEFLGRNPGCLVCEQNLASDLFALGRLDEAKQHIDALLPIERPTLAPEYGQLDLRTDALRLGGRIYAARGDDVRARALYEQALARRPDDGNVRGEIARLKQLDGAHGSVR